MNSEKRALFFFICMILAIYSYGIIHDYIYINRIETSSGITLSHDEFRDVKIKLDDSKSSYKEE